MAADAPRVGPGERAEIGLVNDLISRALGAATGGGPPNIFTTLGRHRSLFRRWLVFAAGLMPGGRLPRRDSELVILRVAHNCSCDYEWRHHERLGRRAGLSPEQVAAARERAPSASLSERQRLLLRVADELHATRDLSEGRWTALRAELSEVEAIELFLLVGHYEMLAMTLNALRVPPDAPPGRSPSRVALAVQRLAERSSRRGRADGAPGGGG